MSNQKAWIERPLSNENHPLRNLLLAARPTRKKSRLRVRPRRAKLKAPDTKQQNESLQLNASHLLKSLPAVQFKRRDLQTVQLRRLRLEVRNISHRLQLVPLRNLSRRLRSQLNVRRCLLQPKRRTIRLWTSNQRTKTSEHSLQCQLIKKIKTRSRPNLSLSRKLLLSPRPLQKPTRRIHLLLRTNPKRTR